MLPKKQRVPRALWSGFLNSRRYFHSRHFVLKVASSDNFRGSVSVSKKVSPKAVERNRVRRNLYREIAKFATFPDDKMILVIAKPGSEKIEDEDLSKELSELFKKV